MNNAEERISNAEDRIRGITQSGQQTENQVKKHESNRRDNIKQANLHIIGLPEEEKENNKQDEEAEKPLPVKPTGELT